MKKLTKKQNEELAIKELEEALSAEDSEIKVRITAMIDLDILKELKARAKKNHTKYQTLLNSILREALFEKESNNDHELRLRALEKILRISQTKKKQTA